MLRRFLQFIEENALAKLEEKILLAVSGGLDSVVMVHLFHRAGFRFAIAHCNFQLRGKESDQDALFVKSLAESFGAEYFEERFDVASFAKKRGMSLQEAARTLRYTWLAHVCREKSFDHIATAHHLDDSIETMLFNLIRGCGLRGLHGILPQKGLVIRPLLFAYRAELEGWAKKEGIHWRDDSTNETLKYDRNKIRLEVLPAMEKVHPRVRKNLVETMQRLRETEAIFDAFLARFRDEAFFWSSGRLCLKKSVFTYGEANQTLLHELLAPFGFKPAQISQISAAFDHQPGARFFSQTHCLLMDRNHLEIVPLSKQAVKEVFIEEIPATVEVPEGIFHFEWIDATPEELDFKEDILFMDFDKVVPPMKLRRWEAGDIFQPLGMGGKHQKLQDFFSNNKLSLFDKEHVWLLVDAEKICWIAGYRSDERVKVGPKTHRILKVTFKKNTFVPANPTNPSQSNPQK